MNDALKDALGNITEGVETISKKQTTAEEKFLEMENSLKTFEARMVDVEKMKERGFVPGLDDEEANREAQGKDKFSIFKAYVAIATGNWKNAGYEQEVFNATEKDLETGTGSAGEFLVPTQHVTDMIELLRNRIIAVRLGAREMTGLTQSPVEIPRLDGGATGSWIGENAEISSEDQVFGQISMIPHQASALTRLSNRLLMLSNPDAERVIRDDLASALGILIDAAVLRGTGAAEEPTGIANTPGINVVPVGGAITYNALTLFLLAVEESNADLGSLGWAMSPRLKNRIANLLDADNRPLFQWDPALQTPKSTILSFPFEVTNAIPNNLSGTDTELYFGNWADVIIGMWGGLELAASKDEGDSFKKNQTAVRAIQNVDVAIRHAQSFAFDDTITT